MSRLAEDLAALLQRLEIPAVICNDSGELLASTSDADRIALARGLVDLRSTRITLCGSTLCVTTRQDRAEARDLTPRQQAVVYLLAEGLNNLEIAARLGISPHTVRRHVEGLLQRLGLRSREEAVTVLRHRAAAGAAAGRSAAGRTGVGGVAAAEGEAAGPAGQVA